MRIYRYGARLMGILTMCLGIHGCSEYPPDFPRKQNQVAVDCPPIAGSSSPRFTGQAPAFLQSGHALVASCNLERIDENIIGQVPLEVKINRPLKVAGWVADTGSASVPETVVIRAVSEGEGQIFYAPIFLGVSRDDVVRHLGGGRGYLQSGFDVEVDFGELAPGAYQLQLAFSSKGRANLCDNGRRLVVTK